MSVSKKSNPTPQVTEAHVSAADMLRQVIVTGKAARTAALGLVCSATGFLFLVNHFLDSNAKGYMTRSDATAYLKKELAAQADVKGGMLDIYISRADSLYSKLVGSMKMFSPVIQSIGTATTAEAIGAILSDWLEGNWKIKSLSQLSEQLGYKTGRAVASAGGLTAAKVEERATNTIKAIEKIVREGDKTGKKVSEARVAKAVIGGVSSPLAFATEAIKRLTLAAELDAIIAAVTAQRAELAKLADKANESAAELAAQHAETVERHKKHKIRTGPKPGKESRVHTASA